MPRAQELQTREYSRILRKNMTDTEKRLWNILRGKQLKGFKFRRQFPIDVYIADFICIEQRLIIELDGGQHAAAENYDTKRTHYLESQGFQVLRFWNNDVLENAEGVITVLLQYLPPPTLNGLKNDIRMSFFNHSASPARGEGFSKAPAHA